MAQTGKTIVIVGSGPGIGVRTGCRFASAGFNVALLSRNADRLAQDASAVSSSSSSSGGGSVVKTYIADAADETSLDAALCRVGADFAEIEVVHYNAARVAESAIGECPVDDIVQDFRIINVGLYVTARWALPLLKARARPTNGSSSDSSSSSSSGGGGGGAKPSLLVTGGEIYKQPLPSHFSLSMNKAAQRNLTQSLVETAGRQDGVHVATVSIGGVVADDHPTMSARNIADKFFELYEGGDLGRNEIVLN